SPGYLLRTKAILPQLKGIPICASVVVSNLDQVAQLLDSGLEIVGLSLDAANEEVYRHFKGGSFNQALGFIEEAAKRFPGRIATHLIVGLGETEEEIARLIQRLHHWGVIVALFAFTPNPGTALENQPAPPLSSYRRIQIARHLIVRGLARAEEFVFSPEGRILGFGLEEHELWDALKDGRAFQTSGCPGCNRPYYNERPGGPLYNYPRPLNPVEIQQAMREAALPLTKGQKERIIRIRGGG
ncbi:MAG: radical SAM protein, partial [Anaerolineae bacterium]